MPLIVPRYRALFLVLFSVFMLYGTSMTIIGATLPKILAEFDWDYLVAGWVIGAGAVAFFLSTFAAGHLIKYWGPKPTLVAGLLLDVVGLAFFASTADPRVNILLSALIGLGQGAVEIVVNWSTLRIDSEESGRPMNLMHGAFAVGAILGPLAVGLLLRHGFDWIGVYRGMALLMAVLAALMLCVALPERASSDSGPAAAKDRPGAHPAYWLSFAALFVYVGVELGLSNWVAEYFVAVFDYSAANGALLVSVFWAGLLAGRFGVPLLLRESRQDRALLGLSALITGSTILLALLGFAAPNAVTAAFGVLLVFLAGLGCSIYYPAVITLLGGVFPRAQSQAIAFAATGGGVGAFLFPFLMSALAQHWGIRAGFAAYAFFAIVMTMAAAAFVRASRPQSGGAGRV